MLKYASTLDHKPCFVKPNNLTKNEKIIKIKNLAFFIPMYYNN